MTITMNFLWKDKALILLLALLLIADACYAEDYTLKDELSAYSQGNFKQAVEIGRAVVKKEPQNVVAHYYLANAYAQLKLFQDAVPEYTICAQATDSPKIKSYAQAALNFLKEQNNGPKGSGTESNSGSVEGQMEETEVRLGKELDEKINVLKSEATQKINRLNQERDSEIGQIPKYIVYPDGSRKDNPDYDNLSGTLNKAVEEKTNKISAELSRQIDQLEKYYKIKTDSLNASAMGMTSQFKEGSGNIQIDPTGTNLYVHNYVNYTSDIVPPPPLVGMKATAKSLSITGTINNKKLETHK